jgi:hypothetical protein
LTVAPPLMSAPDETTKGFTLGRWSQRKLAAARGEAPAAPPSTPVPAAPPPAAAAPVAGDAAPAVLPPIEALTIDSDFTAYLQPKVDAALRRQALKKLFSDPHFNVMDGLDIYIDDYGKPDPLPPGMLEQLVQGRYLFDPPATRVNAAGFVEDVAPDEVAALAADAPDVDAIAAAPDTAAGDADRASPATVSANADAGTPNAAVADAGAAGDAAARVAPVTDAVPPVAPLSTVRSSACPPERVEVAAAIVPAPAGQDGAPR